MPAATLRPKWATQEIIDALATGRESLRSIAKKAGVTHQSVSHFKKKSIDPARRNAAKLMKLDRIEGAANDGNHHALTRGQAVSQEIATRELSQELQKQNPFIERIQFLWDECRDGVLRAKDSVRTVTDEDGKLVPVGSDFGALAQMLNQAHRNAELFGKGTGLLQEVAANSPGSNHLVLLPVNVNVQLSGSTSTTEQRVTDVTPEPPETK